MDTQDYLVQVSEQVANSFSHTGKPKEELLSSAWLGVSKAHKVWDTGKAPKEAFLYLVGRQSVVRQLGLEEGKLDMVSIPEEEKEDTILPLEFHSSNPEDMSTELKTMLEESRITNKLDTLLAYSRWIDGRSVSEIADILDSSVWKVRSRLVRIREAIRRMYVVSVG